MAQIRPDHMSHSTAQHSTTAEEEHLQRLTKSQTSSPLQSFPCPSTVFSTSSTQKAHCHCDRDPIIPLEEDSRAHDPDQRCQRLQLPTITRRLVLNALSPWPNIATQLDRDCSLCGRKTVEPIRHRGFSISQPAQHSTAQRTRRAMRWTDWL